MKRIALASIVALSFTACGDNTSVPATAAKGDAFCTLAQTAHDDNKALNDMSNSDLADKAKIKLRLTAAIDSLTAMVAKAPKDVVVSAKKQLEVELAVEKLFKDNDYDLIKVTSSDAGKKVLAESQSSTADEELKSYLNDKCGIAPPATTPADTTPLDTTPLDTTPVDTATGDTINLGEGDAAINKFLDLYEISVNVTLTADQRSCIVSDLSGKVTGADLNEAINSGNGSQAVEQALRLAFTNCNVTPQS
jgi:hypothetical protein